MGRTKDLFIEDRNKTVNNVADEFLDEDYHYKQWLHSQDSEKEMTWIAERDGRTFEDIERETIEENPIKRHPSFLKDDIS